MIEIRLFSTYFDVTYTTEDISISQWENFLENYKRGNENVISFKPISFNPNGFHSKLPEIVTISPENWNQITVNKVDKEDI